MVTQAALIDQRPEQPNIEQDVRANAPRSTAWILFILSFIAVMPFWTVRYPVMTDYPNHLARWFVLFHIKDGAYRFADLYAPAWGLLPYISPDILAMVLQHFLPIDIVGRCALSLCVILVACAMYFFLREACPENSALASFGILVAFNPMFLMGSISYMFSLAFCLLVVGLWVNYCRVPKVMTAVSISAGLLLVYFSHVFGFAVAGLAMGVYGLFQEERWKKLAILALLSLPALSIFVYNPSHAGIGGALDYTGLTVLDKLRHLIFPLRLYASKRLDLLFLTGLALFVFLVLKKRPKFVVQPVWLAVCAILLLAYSLAPGFYGLGGYIDLRFLSFAYVFLPAVIRFIPVPRWMYTSLVLLVLLRVATWEQLFISQQPELQQLTASFEVIPRNAKILPLTRGPAKGIIGTAGLHHLDYGVILRGFLDPQLFHLPGVQPIRIVGSPYCVDILCNVADAPSIDWQRVADSYEYLWEYNDPEIRTFASRIGDAIFSNNSVTVYRIRHRGPSVLQTE